MKKIYTLLLASLFVGSVVAADGEIVRSFTMYNLTKEKLNSAHLDSQGKTLIFSTNESTNTLEGEDYPTMLYTKWSTTDPLACIGETVTEKDPYDVVTLRGNTAFSLDNSPHILIELPEGHNFTDVEVLGHAAGGPAGAEAELVCAFSTSGTEDEDFKVDIDNWTPELRYLQNGCSDLMKQSLLEGTKYIKLIAYNSFAGVSIGFKSFPRLLAINLYAKDTGTGIGEDTEKTLDVKVYGRNLQLSEQADVVIYDITGKTVAQYSAIEDAYLDSLNSGIYIIGATTQNGASAKQKIMIR